MSHATRIHAHLLKYTFHTDMTLHVYNWEKIYLKKKKKLINFLSWQMFKTLQKIPTLPAMKNKVFKKCFSPPSNTFFNILFFFIRYANS